MAIVLGLDMNLKCMELLSSLLFKTAHTILTKKGVLFKTVHTNPNTSNSWWESSSFLFKTAHTILTKKGVLFKTVHTILTKKGALEQIFIS